MLLPKFEYLAARDLTEACSWLSKYKAKASAMAGGTDLLVKMKHKETSPQYVIGLKGIPGLDAIDYDRTSGLRIGALATIESLAASPLVQRNFPALAQAASRMATPQVRNIATIGGNLCNAAPSADTASPLIVLGAGVRLVGPQGERTVSLEKFFTGPGQTVLKPGEILAEIQVPQPPARTGAAYLKLSRVTVDLALVGVAALITLATTDGVCQDVKIALGAVAPTPMRARKAESVLKGQKVTAALIEKAAQLASEEARPITDVRGSAYYRTEMVKVLTRRALAQALKQAK